MFPSIQNCNRRKDNYLTPSRAKLLDVLLLASYLLPCPPPAPRSPLRRGKTCRSKYFRNLPMNSGLTLAWTLLCPIPLMNTGSALYGPRTVSSSRSEWLNGTMVSFVPWMSSAGLRMLGAKSTFGKRSPGRVHPLSRTIR